MKFTDEYLQCNFGIDKRILELVSKSEKKIEHIFGKYEDICAYNQYKVLDAFQKNDIGRYYGDPVSSGQGLGQKNTILAVWMAQTYLHPLTAIAPSGYILWQNMINSSGGKQKVFQSGEAQT